MSASSNALSDTSAELHQLPKEAWVDLQGLIDCAASHLSRRAAAENPDAPSPSMRCSSISYLGSGSYNHVYRLDFGDGTILAASVTKDKEKAFLAAAKLSEIATMKFVRDSGLYPDVRVPEVYAWDTTFTNPVGAPYVFMEFVPGVVINNTRVDPGNPCLLTFDAFPERKQLAIVKALSRLRAALSKPVPFTKLGSIVFADAATNGGAAGTADSFSIGPLMTINQTTEEETLGGPYSSVQEMWHWLQEERILQVVQRWCTLESDNIHEPDSSVPVFLTPRTFSELYRFLTALIPHFEIPKPYDTLVLHHPDFALRNIIFDEASLDSGHPKVAGLIDWSGAQVLPLMLAAQFPPDLFSNDKTPFRRTHKNPPEVRWGASWGSVPYDWTCIGNPSEYPTTDETGFNRPANPNVDYKPALTVLVRRYYLRTYFSSSYAAQMHAIHGEKDLARTAVHAEAPYYLKFHEAMCSDLAGLGHMEDWIRETYWRLRVKGTKDATEKGTLHDPATVVVGPNVYHGSVERTVRDLRMFAEEADAWGLDPYEIFDVDSESGTEYYSSSAAS